MASTTDKIKHALHMDKNASSTTTSHTSTTQNNGVHDGITEPHSSRVANTVDPRVENDLDKRHAGIGSTGVRSTGVSSHATHGTHGTYPGAHGTGATGHSTTAGYTDGPATKTAGPHNSNLLNKADPTVDSDLDGSRNLGATSGQRTAGYSGAGNTANTGASYGTNTGVGSTGYNNHSTTTAVPHSSNIANKVDPRIDSNHGAYTSTGTGVHNRHGGGIPSSGAYGNGTTQHLTVGAGGVSTTPGSGNAPNTAGPHNSDLLNKLDPRVDSDLSGGKTFGGDKTYT